MKTKLSPFEVAIPNLEGDGIAEIVPIEIEMEWDEEIQDWLVTPAGEKAIEDTKARYLGLVAPEALKEFRRRLNLSQAEMGELLQIGEKSWSRWENGRHRPSRSFNLLIKALVEGEVSLAFLKRQLHYQEDWSKVLPFKKEAARKREPLVLDKVLSSASRHKTEGSCALAPQPEEWVAN